MIPGPTITADGSAVFLVWAPRAQEVSLHLHGPESGEGAHRFLPMERGDRGYFTLATAEVVAGSRYTFRKGGIDAADAKEFPDPASAFQPDGVHAPSEIVDHDAFPWSYAPFAPPAPENLVIYELHVGAFTPEGTFESAARRLPELAALGITAVELMPVAQFAGIRNWGYDGVYPYAVQASYGGPDALRQFVGTAHEVGLAVLLDVVYNHLGPEGNYSGQFGNYFTDRYRTPWGDAVNVDGEGSDEVRHFFRSNLRHWMSRYHIDGFRLDAVHEIHDESAVPFLLELSDEVRGYSQETGKRHLIIAESDLNDRRIVEPADRYGMAMDATWADDFHHAVHATLTGERQGYFADFGGPSHIASCLRQGWSYDWRYSVHRGRRHGNSPQGLAPRSFVFCTQNHDQVGNRMLGERLRSLVGRDADRLARALLLLAPYVPLLFMGQEYGEDRPFLYFVDHGDPALLQATREGREREFRAFHTSGSPPDPGSRKTLEKSILNWDARTYGEGEQELALTSKLLGLRSMFDCLRPSEGALPDRTARAEGELIELHSRGRSSEGLLIASLSDTPARVGFDSLLSLRAGGESDSQGVEFRRVFALSEFDRDATGESFRAGDELDLAPYDVWLFVRTPPMRSDG